MNNNQVKTEKLLEDIKSLLILDLSRKDVSNKEIGSVLGISYKTVERFLPKKKISPKKEKSKEKVK